MNKAKILSILDTISEPAELTEYAAAAAAGELAGNWESAFRDNPDREIQGRIVRNDIELVCQMLREFGDAVQNKILSAPLTDRFSDDPPAGQV